MSEKIHATTVLGVLRDGKLCIGSDGQVTKGNIVMKDTANKIRTLADGKVIAGFAGSVSDALTLFDKFDAKMNEYQNMKRAAFELSKEWRKDKFLRKLDALLIVGNKESLFVIGGDGNVIKPDNDILAIGSGGAYAESAATALLENTDLDSKEIVEKSLTIAGNKCIYTNNHKNIEVL